MTEWSLWHPSSTPSISSSSSCLLTSPFTTLSSLYSLCFPFSILPRTSVTSPSDSGHDICSLSESWLSIPASLSNAAAILRMSFLSPYNSSKLSSFCETSTFHSASICCFAFHTFDLLAISTLAFVRALSVSKGLQAALALVQGAQEVA